MFEEIAALFQEHYEGEDEISITPETSIMEDLDLSSLEFFALVNEIEKKYGIKIKERELQNIATVGEMLEIVEKKIKEM